MEWLYPFVLFGLFTPVYLAAVWIANLARRPRVGSNVTIDLPLAMSEKRRAKRELTTGWEKDFHALMVKSGAKLVRGERFIVDEHTFGGYGYRSEYYPNQYYEGCLCPPCNEGRRRQKLSYRG